MHMNGIKICNVGGPSKLLWERLLAVSARLGMSHISEYLTLDMSRRTVQEHLTSESSNDYVKVCLGHADLLTFATPQQV